MTTTKDMWVADNISGLYIPCHEAAEKREAWKEKL